MNEFQLQNAAMLQLLWTLPVLAALFWRAAAQRRRTLAQFTDEKLIARIQQAVNRPARRWKEILVLLSLAAVTVGLARPAWNPQPVEVTRQGRDVVFLVDVSRSMLAEDLPPNRLERAKLAVLDAISRLQGDRVALIAFAGAASIKCPLTVDYGFFRMALEELSPESAPRGGTLIGDAIRRTLKEVFDENDSQYRDIVLITDGEDHESFPVKAAESAGRRGVRLIVIGLGDENVGKRIPVTDGSGRQTFLKYDGQEIWSRLDADTLRRMAAATPGGRYLNVATGTIDFGEVYVQLIASAERRVIEGQTVVRYEEKFQLFLGAGFLLLLGELLISERRKA